MKRSRSLDIQQSTCTNNTTSPRKMEKATETTLQLFAARRGRRPMAPRNRDANTQQSTTQSIIIVATSPGFETDNTQSNNSAQSQTTNQNFQTAQTTEPELDEPYDIAEMKRLKRSDFAAWTIKAKEQARRLLPLTREEHRTPTLAAHYRTLRRPGGSKLQGMYALSPEACNTSDTYHRFLQRSAELKIRQTVARWREIICTKECCEDKMCNEMCCIGKSISEKKLTGRSSATKHQHLEKALKALGRDVKKWKYPGYYEGYKHLPLTVKAEVDVCNEYEWAKLEVAMNRAWENTAVRSEGNVERLLERWGTSVEEIERGEKKLRDEKMVERERCEEDKELQIINRIGKIGDALDRIEAIESKQQDESQPLKENTPDNNNDTEMTDISSEEPAALRKAREAVEWNEYLLKTAIYHVKRDWRKRTLDAYRQEQLQKQEEAEKAKEDVKEAREEAKNAEEDDNLCFVKIRRRRLRPRNRLGWDFCERKGVYRVQIAGPLLDEIGKLTVETGRNYRAIRNVLLRLKRNFVVRRNVVRRRMMMLCAMR